MADEMLKSRHAFGALERVAEVISSGKVDAYDILFVTDENGKPHVGWVDKDNNPVIVQDEEDVFVVEALPETGEEGKIYIFKNEAYIWNGTQFASLSKPADLTALEAEIATKVDSDEVDAKISTAVADTVSVVNSYTDEKIETVLTEHLVKKYEFTDVPEGTLVDYREDEIRIMCPKSVAWTKQVVGDGGDENCYYATFKVYVPNENIVGYIEHLNGQVDGEILTAFSTDEYGRKYQPTWLALAIYDEATTTWTYYGEKSTVNKYIGWDYQIDWYNADDEIVSSDTVRISLSNESCHFVNEPYYVGSIMSDVDTKIEEKIEEKITEIQTGYEIVEF